MPSTAHTRKRHITTSSAQPNKITSYFSSTNHVFPTSLDYANSAPYAGTTLSPAVPNEIQSSLLNVGMRVRKAVPEGYKQWKVKPLVSETSVLPPNSIANVQRQPQVQMQSAPRGLEPMCGMHKIGGLGVQNSSVSSGSDFANNWTIGNVDGDDEYDAFPLSSQESTMTVSSTDSMPASRPSMKRGFSDDDEENENDEFTMETTTMPMSTMGGITTRPLAPLKRASNRRQRWTAVPMPMVRQRTVSGEAEMDFEEAVFLRPRSRSGSGDEMVM